jgi:U4/U6 small nuclear ribonucleoprotein PRP3
MGVLPPPPPKLRLANLARVLGAAATADPSRIEAQARADAEARLDAHLKRNEDRKLTEKERRQKQIKNWAPAEGESLRCAVFVVSAEIDNRRQFKICKNAQQLQLVGCAIKTETTPLLVVAEGKAKSLARFERLMLRRIKWGNNDDKADEEDDGDGDGEGDSMEQPLCKKVWSGVVGEAKNFRKFFWESCTSEEQARKFLASKESENFWDLVTT